MGVGKNKIQNILTLKHSYEFYIKDILPTSKYSIKAKTYRDICQRFNEMIIDKIINEGYIFRVPYGLGVHRIIKRQVHINTMKPDFGLFNESDREYKNKHLNEHTGGYYCKFHWRKKDMIVKNKSAYCFIPTRWNKRYLASRLKEDGKELVNKYFE